MYIIIYIIIYTICTYQLFFGKGMVYFEFFFKFVASFCVTRTDLH